MPPTFKGIGNKNQFAYNEKLRDIIQDSLHSIEINDVEKAKEKTAGLEHRRQAGRDEGAVGQLHHKDCVQAIKHFLFWRFDKMSEARL